MFLVLCFFLFVCSVIIIFSQKYYFLIILLSFELIVMSIFVGWSNYIWYSGVRVGVVFSIIFLTFRVCEARIGLSLLVASVRFLGQDYNKNAFVLNF